MLWLALAISIGVIFYYLLTDEDDMTHHSEQPCSVSYPQAAERTCLKCGRIFYSQGPSNRIFGGCISLNNRTYMARSRCKDVAPDPAGSMKVEAKWN